MSLTAIGPEQISGNTIRVSGTDMPPHAAKVYAGPARQHRSAEDVVALKGEMLDVARMQEVKAGFHKLAGEVRDAHTTLAQVSDYIDRMKENLNSIVKQFPPFPPGSEERVTLLRSYNAFRVLIDSLTLPRPLNSEQAGMSQIPNAAQAGMLEDGYQEATSIP